MPDQKAKALTGFTYLEILAALIIISMALIPIMRIIPEGMKVTRRVERLTRAAFLGQSKMDEIRSQILGLNPNYGFDKPGGYDGSGNFGSDSDYYYTVTDDEGDSIKELSVTVWFDEDGDGTQDADEDNLLRLDTKIANRG